MHIERWPIDFRGRSRTQSLDMLEAQLEQAGSEGNA